jgi:hypothetical protein
MAPRRCHRAGAGAHDRERRRPPQAVRRPDATWAGRTRIAALPLLTASPDRAIGVLSGLHVKPGETAVSWSSGYAQFEQTTNHACSRRPREARPRSLRAFRATRRRRSGLRARRPHQPIAACLPRPLARCLASRLARLPEPNPGQSWRPVPGSACVTRGAGAPMGVAAALIPITPSVGVSPLGRRGPRA